jgi:hypothetical protein
MNYFIYLLLLVSSLAWSQTQMAQPATQLQKLSRALNGKNARVEDLKKVQSFKTTGEVQDFLRIKAREYISNKNFKTNFKFKIDELFKLRTMINSYDTVPPSSYDSLVMSIINENKSWDQLLLAKDFKVFISDNHSAVNISYEGSEHKFYEILTGGLDNTFEDFTKIIAGMDLISFGYTSVKKDLIEKTYSFSEQDERVAGIMSTQKFFQRYTNTALNKNRRRAAFLFDVFLCDPMVPVVPAISNENELKDINFSVGKDLTEDQIKAHTKVDPHGRQADCMVCHEKLDPMGQVFSNSNLHLSPFATPGALFYRRSGQSPISTPVSGLRSLAKSISQQQEYVKCQTQHFWKWFIGDDVPLTDARQAQIVEHFTSIDRKPIDFILYLVEQPEFKKAPMPLTENQLLAREAVRVLKTCHSCHKQNESELIDYWDMSVFPYGQDLKTRELRVAEMKKQLDTKNNSQRPRMPPRSSVWKPTQQEYSILNQWLKKGAPDLNGELQVEAVSK